MDDGVAGPNEGQQSGGDGRHARVEHRAIFAAVQGTEPSLDHRQVGMAKPTIDIGLGFTSDPPRAVGIGAVKEGLVDILGLLSRAIDKG